MVTRLDSVSGKFHSSTGHKHTGSPGDGAPVSAQYIANPFLAGFFIQGVDLTAASGLSTNVSTQLSTKTPSSTSTTLGVVVNTPYNKIILRYATGINTDDAIIDGTGNQVYGRLTESAGVWTLSYYVNLSGVETAYSLPSTDVRWYYQELYNPIYNNPVYSELAITPSDNAAADVPDSSETTAGKVLLANTAPPAVASASAKGTGTRAAKDDHTHEGVHSLGIAGNPPALKGDVNIEAGTNVTLAYNSQNIVVNSNTNNLLTTAANDTTAGADQTLATTSTLVVNITGALTSIAGITAPATAQGLILCNKTGGAVTVRNESGSATAANRILTGTGADLNVANNASIWLIYDLASARWRVIGGSGGGSDSVFSSQLTLTAGGTITLDATSKMQTILIEGNGTPVTLSSTPFTTTAPQNTTMIKLICNSDANTVEIPFNDAAKGVLGYSKTLGRGQTITYEYNSTLDRYVILATSN